MGKSGGTKICSDKRPPHFYKIINTDLPNQCLRIPPAFIKHISKENSERAILEGPNGNHWHVNLSKTSDGTFLQDGWQDFLRDHSLWNNEFLVFRYDGNMCFNVQIFDKTGCERKNVFTTTKTHQGSDFFNGGKKWVRSSKKFVNSSGKKRGRPLKRFVSSSSMKRGRPSKKFVTSSGKKRGRTPKQFTGSAQLSESKACYKDPGIETVAHKRIRTEDTCQPICEMNSQIRSCSSGGRLATEKQRAEVWKAAKSFTSNRPYFMRRLNKSNVYITYVLKIPTDFAQVHFPITRVEVVLRSPKGKAWIVNFVPGKAFAFCGGWTAFARDNKLEEGDICIFELVGELEMLVHTFRLVNKVRFAPYERR